MTHETQGTPDRILTLGDSYTIGEGLPPEATWPHQLLAHLVPQWGPLELDVLARTGWTSGELWQAIQQREWDTDYAWATLLIGVNNQYRGLSLSDFERELDQLIQFALTQVSRRAHRLCILSIPDWGVTPFATGRDRQRISAEIDRFNQRKREACDRLSLVWIDLTETSRRFPDAVVEDGLHPNSQVHGMWAERVAQGMLAGQAMRGRAREG